MTSESLPSTVKTTYREAVRAALVEALERDPRVFLMGEDIGRYGCTYAVTRGLYERFGPERIRDAPLSESAFVGAGIGAALGGMRPIVEIMSVNFSLLALDQIVNHAALLRHMSGGQLSVPLVLRMSTGAGRQLAAQHSHSLEGWFAHVPGLRVVTPATVEDGRGTLGACREIRFCLPEPAPAPDSAPGLARKRERFFRARERDGERESSHFSDRLLASALALADPVVIFEHVGLYNMDGQLAADAGVVPLTGARVRRAGRDVSLITYGGSLWKTLEAASLLGACREIRFCLPEPAPAPDSAPGLARKRERFFRARERERDGERESSHFSDRLLTEEDIDAEVLDLRSLRPLDTSGVLDSIRRTHRAVIVDEGWLTGSFAAEVSARIVEGAFYDLDAPPQRVCAREVPIPYARHLEEAALPQPDRIVAAARQMVRGHG